MNSSSGRISSQLKRGEKKTIKPNSIVLNAKKNHWKRNLMFNSYYSFGEMWNNPDVTNSTLKHSQTR